MKKGVNLTFLLTLLTYLIQVQRTFSFNTKTLQLEIDCSQYEDDHDITHSFPFIVHPNPTVPSFERTYAKMNEDHNVYSLRIINEKSVPSQIYCLKHLTGLEIVNMDTDRKFPVDIEYLPISLTVLGIYGTKIIQIPEEISQLKQLEALVLSNTNLVSIPDSIGDLTSLIIINLENNNLKSLPKTMKNLQSLKGIFLLNNSRLRSIESLNGLPSLETLDVSKCSITTLPRNLPLLHELHMSNNKLTTLSGIQTLGFGTNNSKSFYFEKNHIQSITPQIQYVVNLHELNLRQNKLHTLPTYLFSVKTLTVLNIKQNPFRPRDLRKIVSEFHTKMPNATIFHD